MRAARIHSFGGPVQIDEVDPPAAGPGEVVVDLRAVALNPIDLWVIEGSVAGGSQRLPFVLGCEGVGTTDGRRVVVNGGGIGSERDGLLRERAAVPAQFVFDVPDAVDDAQAAALSVVGITSKRILEVGRVQPGTLVVVLGASGGVGSVAAQAAKLIGATVVAVTGAPEKRAWVEQLGADLTVVGDDIPAALTDAFGRLADVVLNPLGGESVGEAVDMLVPGGCQVLYGRSAGDRAVFSAAGLYRKSNSILGFGGLAEDEESKRPARTWLFEQIAAGRLAIPVEKEFPLSAAAEAFDSIRTRETPGKAVVRIGDG